MRATKAEIAKLAIFATSYRKAIFAALCGQGGVEAAAIVRQAYRGFV